MSKNPLKSYNSTKEKKLYQKGFTPLEILKRKVMFYYNTQRSKKRFCLNHKANLPCEVSSRLSLTGHVRDKFSNVAGFTLIELVVVIIIIGVLSSIALPMYNSLVERSRTSEAIVTLRSILDSQRREAITNDTYAALEDLDINVTEEGRYYSFTGTDPATIDPYSGFNETIATATKADGSYYILITETGEFYSDDVNIVLPSCFLAGILITMADERQKPIEEIQVGDVVLAFNEDTGQIEPDTVTEVFSNLKQDTYFIINRTLKVTSTHPVLSKGRWVEIKDLKIGDTLTDTQGEDVIIFDIAQVKESIEVYNFQTNPLHTYIANGFIVHNKFNK